MADKNIQNLLIKQEIRDVLSRYCRGLDRMDKAMAYSVFHEDASADYIDLYKGTGHGFIDYVWEAHASMQCHSHQISNVLCEVQGDTAVSEAYVTVLLWTKPSEDNQQQEIIIRGRYLDRWSTRNNRWAISERTHIIDTHTVSPLCKGPISEQSARNESDPSFNLFK